jgi:photosystem II stability/assembly factor-like uncharacterized protein
VKANSSAYPGGVPPLASVEFVSPSQGWVAGAGRILATSDGGANWSTVYHGPARLYQVDFTDAVHGWALSTSALLSTSDGGRTWKPLPEPCGLIDSVHFVTPERGYAISGVPTVALDTGTPVAQGGGQVLETTNGGRSWNTVPTAPARAETVCFANQSDGFVGIPGQVWRSTDGGTHWMPSFSEPPAAANQAVPPDATAVECAGPSAAWTLFTGGGAAMSHSPYIAYATQDGQHWRALLEETYTESALRPQAHAPDGPGSYPGPFSAISPSSGAYVGWTPPEGYGAAPLDLVTGNSKLTKAGNVRGLTQPYAAAFISPAQGWVVGTDQTTASSAGPAVIEETSNGGKSWTRQLTLP